jgi:hypothetical protein
MGVRTAATMATRRDMRAIVPIPHAVPRGLSCVDAVDPLHPVRL